MTSSPPSPPDAGGELPDTGIDDPHESGHEPNYLIRRAIAVGTVVAVLAGGSVVAGRIMGGDNDDDNETSNSADWNTVVVVADDEIRLVDPKTGDTVETIPGEEALLDAESLATGDTLVLMNDFGRITELDLSDGTIRRSSAPQESTLHVSAENPSIVLAGPPAGGDVAIVDTNARTTLEIGETSGLGDPLMFVGTVLVNPSGSHVATADARSFQSVVVDVENDTAVLLAGQVVALNDEAVVTAQRAGDLAELEFYDLAGQRRGSAEAPSPQVTMLTGDSSALVVTTDGTIASVTAKGTVNVVGALDGDAGDIEPAPVVGGVPTTESTRLIVVTEAGVVVLDQGGGVVARSVGELLSPANRASKCALIGSDRPTGTAMHIDLETGEELGQVAGGIVASASADGCTISIIGDASRIVVRGVELDLKTTTGSIAIAPDGSAYVITTLSGDRLVALGGDEEDGSADPIFLADEPVLIRFAEI